MKNFLRIVLFLLVLPLPVWAQEQAVQNPSSIMQDAKQVIGAPSGTLVPKNEKELSEETGVITYKMSQPDEDNYTLGANDVISIGMQNHSELSGQYTLNSEGMIQYEFAGDLKLGGLTKKAAEEEVKKLASKYVLDPKVLIKIVEYKSKAVYVIGQVAKPGKYYISSESIPVREAIISAGMPNPGSAMYRARLITPSKGGEADVKVVDLNALLYKGDLQYNLDMHSGDQLYVPTTQEEMDYVQSEGSNDPALNQAEESEDVVYKLGPDDGVKVTVQGHPEISGTYSVNLEGKIQMEMVGDVYVTGLSKKELAEKISSLISSYVDKPNVGVTITDYRSKSIYVMGQVTNPGKYYIRSESITVREAIVEAGLPINGSALHRTRLINTDKDNHIVIRIVDLNALLYKGDMQYNLEMHSGDQLYVPTTQEEMDYVQTANNAAGLTAENTIGGNNPALKQAEEPEPGPEDVVYKLGPDDAVKITVQGHPEISGDFSVNLEGKIQMQMAGDVYVTGLTKKELAEKISSLISSYIDKPTVSVMITDYRSKVYYVIGEVGNPGKYYMRSESITISEAAVAAGLPTLSAAMRKCRLITPAKNGKTITKRVDLYSVLYGGDLDKDAVMRPGDYLYVPSTIMAKALRVVSPVAAPVTSAASAQTGVGNIGSPSRN